MTNSQSFRANIAGLIVNKNKEFLMVQLLKARENEFDFIKGGMEEEENVLDTLAREFREEIGIGAKYEILRQSYWHLIYEWPEELKKERGFRGQARVSYWIFYKEGEITIAQNELKAFKWVPEIEMKSTMLESGFVEEHYEMLWLDWNKIKEENKELFVVQFGSNIKVLDIL